MPGYVYRGTDFEPPKRGRPRKEIDHGTKQGYQQHQYQGVPHAVCNNECRRAWNTYNRAYQKEWRAKKRERCAVS